MRPQVVGRTHPDTARHSQTQPDTARSPQAIPEDVGRPISTTSPGRRAGRTQAAVTRSLGGTNSGCRHEVAEALSCESDQLLDVLDVLDVLEVLGMTRSWDHGWRHRSRRRHRSGRLETWPSGGAPVGPMNDEFAAGAERGSPSRAVHHVMVEAAQRHGIAQISTPLRLPWLEMMHLAVPRAERTSRESTALIAGEHGSAL